MASFYCVLVVAVIASCALDVEGALNFTGVACGNPPDIPNGYPSRQSWSTRTVNGVVQRTDTVTYACKNVSVTPTPNATISCLPGTTVWSKPTPSCGNSTTTIPTTNTNTGTSGSGTSNTTGTGTSGSGSTSSSTSSGPTSGALRGPQCRYNLKLPHSMCLNDSKSLISLEPVPHDEVVKKTNEVRLRVSPAAAKMPMVIYDYDLAVTAERWAAQCPNGHDNGTNRALPDRGTTGPAWSWVGQNICYSSGYSMTWPECIESWASEVVDWTYGVGKKTSSAVIGHYTQLVWDETLRVGCGKAKCSTGWQYVLVCNYGPGGNVASSKNGNNAYAFPYVKA